MFTYELFNQIAVHKSDEILIILICQQMKKKARQQNI